MLTISTPILAVPPAEPIPQWNCYRRLTTSIPNALYKYSYGSLFSFMRIHIDEKFQGECYVYFSNRETLLFARIG